MLELMPETGLKWSEYFVLFNVDDFRVPLLLWLLVYGCRFKIDNCSGY